MDLPNKSDANIPKKEKVKPVISGAVHAPRPATRRFMDFLTAESPKSLAGKVAREVLVPRAKAGFEEAINSFLSGMLWGDSSNRPMGGNIVRGTVLRGGATNYAQISSGSPSALSQARAALPQSQQTGNYQDIICASQQQAEIVLAGLYDLLNMYRVVATADLYELANMTPAPSDAFYGWTSLDGARISKVREGFRLELPRPTLIG